MSIERERRIFELLDEALERSPLERQKFLDEACRDDEPLRQEVESLLDTEVDAGLLAEPAFSVHAEDRGVGRRIGRYQLVRLLDRGGMGSVYLAEREDFEQQVALKLIRRGLDTDEMLVRRFQNERQILARLEHPHIARLLDGGATDDRLPYFVMEYVEGEPIDRYCESRGLSISERLALFRKVCSAVQFAHQNLVVHRDLKPSNILITGDGEPKLLDFGIAKLLDQGLAISALQTELGQGPMTPRYASPEQIRFEPVTTASDVYSLGVLLYELLTGLDPYGVDSRRSDEVARAVCEREPDRPSTAVRRRAAEPEAAKAQRLRRRLSGDLDSIVLKAMRKEPEERYVSAEQLAEDIRRHLEGLPVGAQTGTFTYRAGKFVRRHRLAMAVAVAFLIVIVSFSIATTVLWRKADHDRQTAEAALGILEGFIESADPDKTGKRDISVIEALQRGQEDALESLASKAVELRISVADRLGKILHKAGAYDQSKEMMQEALLAAQTLHGAVHAEVATRLNNLAVLLFEYEEYVQAEARFRDVIQMRQSLGQDPSALFKAKSNLAMTLLRQGQLVEAEILCAEVLADRLAYYEDEAHKDDYDEDVPFKNVAASRHNLAAVYYARTRFNDAELHISQALEARRQTLESPNTIVAISLDLLGSIAAAQGQAEKAERHYREALAMELELLDESHRDVARTRTNLAALLIGREPDTAQKLANRALEVFTDFHTDGWDAAEAKTVLAASRVAAGPSQQAEALLIEGYERMVELRGPDTYRSRLARQRILDLSELLGRPERLERYRESAKPADQPTPTPSS